MFLLGPLIINITSMIPSRETGSRRLGVRVSYHRKIIFSEGLGGCYLGWTMILKHSNRGLLNSLLPEPGKEAECLLSKLTGVRKLGCFYL